MRMIDSDDIIDDVVKIVNCKGRWNRWLRY